VSSVTNHVTIPRNFRLDAASGDQLAVAYGEYMRRARASHGAGSTRALTGAAGVMAEVERRGRRLVRLPSGHYAFVTVDEYASIVNHPGRIESMRYIG
jgi:hypothetical protein